VRPAKHRLERTDGVTWRTSPSAILGSGARSANLQKVRSDSESAVLFRVWQNSVLALIAGEPNAAANEFDSARRQCADDGGERFPLRLRLALFELADRSPMDAAAPREPRRRPLQHGACAAQLSRVDRPGHLLPRASRHPGHSAARPNGAGRRVCILDRLEQSLVPGDQLDSLVQIANIVGRQQLSDVLDHALVDV
jgi:hypothetical protein